MLDARDPLVLHEHRAKAVSMPGELYATSSDAGRDVVPYKDENAPSPWRPTAPAEKKTGHAPFQKSQSAQASKRRGRPRKGTPPVTESTRGIARPVKVSRRKYLINTLQAFAKHLQDKFARRRK